MSSADVSIRFSVQDADAVSAAFAKIAADGQALQSKLAASNQQLAASYEEAFRALLHILTAITVLSAVTVFAFLSRTPVIAETVAPEATELSN